MTQTGQIQKFKVGIFTTSRADFGIYRPVIEALLTKHELDIGLIVTGMHLSEQFGMTIEEIKASGFPIWAQFDGLENGDAPNDISASMGKTTIGAAKAISEIKPDLLLVIGDRFEMHACAVAALPFCVPLAHIHGGEESEGAIDNSFRHSITKLSHLHYCSTELAAKRINSMGENPQNIIIAGAPALDMVKRINLLSRDELFEKFGIPIEKEFALITYHPMTTDIEVSMREFDEMWAALKGTNQFCVFTFANADTSGRALNAKIQEIVDSNPQNAMVVGHMGSQGYFSAMKHAKFMIGNSSSGIIEAASFGLGVINVGDRQKGRERSNNLIDVSGAKLQIIDAINTILSPESVLKIQSCENIYGKGNAGEIIANSICEKLKSRINIQKKFFLS